MTQKESILFRLTELMFQKQQTFLLLDGLYEDEIIGSSIRNIQIDSPFQQLLFEGVLSQYIIDDYVSISFTVEAYFQHLLAKVLEKDSSYSTPESLLELLKGNKLKGLPEAVSNLLSFDVEKGNFNRLTNFIDMAKSIEISNEIFDLFNKPVINSLKENGITKTIERILENETEWDWYLFVGVFKSLGETNEFLQYDFAKILMEYNPLINFSQRILALLSIEILEYNDAKQYYQIIESTLNSVEDNTLNDFYFLLGKVEKRLANYQKSGDYFKKSLALNLKLHGKLHQKVALCYSYLSSISYIKGNFDESINFSNLCKDINVEISGTNTSSIAAHYKQIGLCIEKKGNLDDAIVLFEKSISIYSKTDGLFSSEISNVYNNLGRVYQEKGELDKALEYFNLSLNIDLNTFGENSEQAAAVYNNLGGIYDGKGELDQALIYYEKALGVFMEVFNINHPSIGFAYNNIASIYYEKEIYSKAIIFFRKSAKVRLRSLGFGHPDIADTFENMGYCYKKTAEYNLAIKYFQKAFEINPSAQILAAIAELFELINKKEKALELFLMITNMIFNKTTNPAKIPIRYLENTLRLSKQLNKENELPDWIKNYKTE